MRHSRPTTEHSRAKAKSVGQLSSPSQSFEETQSQKTIAELFGPSKRKDTDDTSSSSVKRLKWKHPQQDSDSYCHPVAPIKPENMYTFNSAATNGKEMVDLTGSPITSARKSSIPQRRPNNFIPHTGTKKLVVKNFRKTSKSSPDQYYNHVWSQLEKALSAIFRHEKIPLEELYKGVENVCRQDKALALFQKLCERCKENVIQNLKAPLIEEARRSAAPIETLRSAIKAWSVWKEQIVWMSNNAL